MADISKCHNGLLGCQPGCEVINDGGLEGLELSSSVYRMFSICPLLPLII